MNKKYLLEDKDIREISSIHNNNCPHDTDFPIIKKFWDEDNCCQGKTLKNGVYSCDECWFLSFKQFFKKRALKTQTQSKKIQIYHEIKK